MTCATFENDLALYVERDLPAAAVPAVEAHLGSCAACRRFLGALRASQAMVQDLAGEPIDADALAGLRARVVATAAVSDVWWRDRSAGPTVWAVAAAVVLAATGVVSWLAMSSRVTPAATRVTTVANARPTPVTPAAPVPTVAAKPGSTRRALPRVSPRMGRAAVAHAGVPVDRSPAAVPALSADDADQLARAVVAVSRIRSVRDVRPEADPLPEPTPMIRLATTDPNVVIYWRLDSNGGQ